MLSYLQQRGVTLADDDVLAFRAVNQIADALVSPWYKRSVTQGHQTVARPCPGTVGAAALGTRAPR